LNIDQPVNILIVDDEPRNLTVLETLLDDPRYRLVRAESAEQALLALVNEEFALLILDIRMPSMNGFELAHMIRERKKTAGVPIIFLTAYYNEDQHVLEGYSTGAVDYLHKPVNPTILCSKVAIFAELYSKTRECGMANHALRVEVTERCRVEARLRALTMELNFAEQRERKRLAGELHDYLAQLLVLCHLNLGRMKRMGLPQNADQVVTDSQEVLSKALDYTRTLMAELSPSVLKEHGLPAGLTWLGEHMQRHGLAVTVNVEPIIDYSLSDDHAMLLFQSVRELLMNVLKHANSPKAAVRLEHHGGKLRIEVRDEGIGFDFAAASGTTTTMSSKLGLHSIGERMKALGGCFDLQSAPGGGTKATLVLPFNDLAGESSWMNGHGPMEEEKTFVHQRHAINFKSADPPLAMPRVPRIRVLLVDDHAMVRRGLRSVLESYSDVEVVGEAGDGEEAVALVERLQPSIVLMDINMPKMDGIQATAEITARHPGIIVIGLSVNTSDATEKAIKQAGAVRLLDKGAAVDDLYSAIREGRR